MSKNSNVVDQPVGGCRMEPIIHSHITDELPESHELAFENVYCAKCKDHLHADYNECMQTWFETEWGNFCVGCFGLTPIIKWGHTESCTKCKEAKKLFQTWERQRREKILSY